MLQILIKLSNYQKNDNIKMFPGQAARGGEGGQGQHPPSECGPRKGGREGRVFKDTPPPLSLVPCIRWPSPAPLPPVVPCHVDTEGEEGQCVAMAHCQQSSGGGALRKEGGGGGGVVN